MNPEDFPPYQTYLADLQAAASWSAALNRLSDEEVATLTVQYAMKVLARVDPPMAEFALRNVEKKARQMYEHYREAMTVESDAVVPLRRQQ